MCISLRLVRMRWCDVVASEEALSRFIVSHGIVVLSVKRGCESARTSSVDVLVCGCCVETKSVRFREEGVWCDVAGSEEALAKFVVSHGVAVLSVKHACESTKTRIAGFWCVGAVWRSGKFDLVREELGVVWRHWRTSLLVSMSPTVDTEQHEKAACKGCEDGPRKCEISKARVGVLVVCRGGRCVVLVRRPPGEKWRGRRTPLLDSLSPTVG